MSLSVPGVKSPHWRTPAAIREALAEEFGELFDPCPNGGIDGLTGDWPPRVFVNPPYGRGVVAKWVLKAILESRRGVTSVMLLPSYTGSPWWHDLVIPYAREVRFLRGKLRFNDGRGVAPFWSAVVIFGPAVSGASASTPTVEPPQNR